MSNPFSQLLGGRPPLGVLQDLLQRGQLSPQPGMVEQPLMREGMEQGLEVQPLAQEAPTTPQVDFQGLVAQVFPDYTPPAQGSGSGTRAEGRGQSPAAPHETSPDIRSLIQTESGGRWNAQNTAMGAGGQRGHFGRLQFGHARLQEAKRAGVIPANMTPQQFMASPDAQRATEAWHFSDIDRQAERRGLTQFIGQEVGGVQINQGAIRAMAHLGGIGGAERFLRTGGRHNPADVNGTSLRDYARTHGRAFATGEVPAPAGQRNPRRQAGWDRLDRQSDQRRGRGRGNFIVSPPRQEQEAQQQARGGGGGPRVQMKESQTSGEVRDYGGPTIGQPLSPHELAAQTMAQRRDFSRLKDMDFGAKVEIIAALGRQSRGQRRG